MKSQVRALFLSGLDVTKMYWPVCEEMIYICFVIVAQSLQSGTLFPPRKTTITTTTHLVLSRLR